MSESGSTGMNGAYFFAFAHEEPEAALVDPLEARRAQPKDICGHDDGEGETEDEDDVARVAVGGIEVQR